MGIKQLFQIIKEEAPDAIKEGDIKAQFGRKVAIVSWPLLIFVQQISMLIIFQGCLDEYLQFLDRRAIRWSTTHERHWRDDITSHGHVLPHATNG